MATNPVELTFPDGRNADFAVRTDAEERWCWSNGRMFTHAIETESVAPGESVRYGGEWNAPESGEHTAVATLHAREHDLKARTTFEVTGTG